MHQLTTTVTVLVSAVELHGVASEEDAQGSSTKHVFLQIDTAANDAVVYSEDVALVGQSHLQSQSRDMYIYGEAAAVKDIFDSLGRAMDAEDCDGDGDGDGDGGGDSDDLVMDNGPQDAENNENNGDASFDADENDFAGEVVVFPNSSQQSNSDSDNNGDLNFDNLEGGLGQGQGGGDVGVVGGMEICLDMSQLGIDADADAADDTDGGVTEEERAAMLERLDGLIQFGLVDEKEKEEENESGQFDNAA